MTGFLSILLVIAMGAVLVTLGLGVGSMLRRGGPQSGETTNKLMRYRVLLQAVAIALFALIMLLGGR